MFVNSAQDSETLQRFNLHPLIQDFPSKLILLSALQSIFQKPAHDCNKHKPSPPHQLTIHPYRNSNVLQWRSQDATQHEMLQKK